MKLSPKHLADIRTAARLVAAGKLTAREARRRTLAIAQKAVRS